MPRSKEYVSTDSDSSDEDAKPKKKQKRSSEGKEQQEQQEQQERKGIKESKKSRREDSDSEDNKWELGNNRYVTVRDFKGKLYVDIREMYYDKDATLKPGKKGICLNTEQWQKLANIVDDVNKAVRNKS